MTDANWTLLERGETINLSPDSGVKTQLTACGGVSDNTVRLIEQTRFGGKGLRYRRLGVRDHVDAMPEVVSLVLTEKGQTVGSYLLNPVCLSTSQQAVRGVYRSTLCVAKDHHGRGLGRLLVSHALNWLDRVAENADSPLVSFGCIERNNRPSMSLLQSAGSRTLGHLETQMVYRQWPRSTFALVKLDAYTDQRVTEAQRVAVTTGLTFAAPQQREFYAVLDGDTVIAGAHANRCRLDFERIGQPWDFLSQYLFAHVGPARRRFDPRNFSYLKLDGVVVTPGHERVWKDLLSTLLARHDTHMAMFALDPRADYAQRLSRSGILGRVAKATRQQLSIQACCHGAARAWPEALLQECLTNPLHVGPFAQ